MFKHTLRHLYRICLVGAALCCIQSCAVETEIGTRYALEKAIWRAEQYKKRAVSDPFSESREDFRAAIATYEEILADSRFHRERLEDRAAITRDLQKLLLKCRTVLAELYLVEYEDCAGVTYPGTIAGRHDLLFTEKFGLRPRKVAGIYDRSIPDSLEIRCAEAFQHVVDDSLLWSGEVAIGDTLLALPAWLARVETGREEVNRRGYARVAEEFYSRVVESRRDDPVAHRARLLRAELRIVERRFNEALDDIDALLSNPEATRDRGDLLLWKTEIQAHGLGLEKEAEGVLKDLITAYPRSAAARGAVLTLAEFEAARGHREEAVRMLRDLELDPATPRETAGAAIFLRALQAERQGDWTEAARLLWRVCHLESFTRAAAVSPWLVIRHYVRAGDVSGVEAALEDAGEFYLQTIGRHIGYLKHPHVLKDFLIESYLIGGKPQVVAELLESHAVRWRVDNGSVGLYKSALIYLRLLHDEKNAVRVLQKSLDVFPTSSYAWIVRAQLDRISPISDEPR